MIKSVVIQNYRVFDDFRLDLKDGLNIIVGDNEAGKSTILEAINLALTKKINGRNIEYELAPYLFNAACVQKFLASLANGERPTLPRILIELYLEDITAHQPLRGSMNSLKEDCVGIKLEICPNEEYREEYAALLNSGSPLTSIPTEYFHPNWFSFANNPVSLKSLPFRASAIDATAIRMQSGSDFFVQDIIRNELSDSERAALGVAYRGLKESFSENKSIKDINQRLTAKKAGINDKPLSLSVDVSQKANWETGLVPHLDSLPFHLAGKGDQSALKIMLALERNADEVNIILVEEPENHMSYSSMNRLLRKIQDRCKDKQIIVSTHSAFVLNKLGLDNLTLLANRKTTRLRSLPTDTQAYFRILPGYDTLRLILAKKAILVEGPSDELIVQKAFFMKHGKLPIDAGVDIISVRGLSFKRFLDIAKEIGIEVHVATDNDGDHAKVDRKYEAFARCANIHIHRSDDNGAATLEPQLVKHNGLAALNKILGKAFTTEDELRAFMKDNKTDCALRLFETAEKLTMPPYIVDAVS